MPTVALHRHEPERERASVVLAASLSAAPRARRVIAWLLDLRGVPDVAFVAQLLTNELVSNALRHAGLRAGESFRLTVECDVATLRVEVADGGPGADPLSRLRDHARCRVHHRGLCLLNALADRWGFRRDEGEFCVWYELDLVPGRRGWLGRMPARHRA